TKKGARIYFSGLDTQNLILVSGYVDAAAIKKGAAREVYLKLQENAYSGENKTVVSRYESLWSEQFPNDDGSAPFVKRFYADSDNINSISLEFSKPIDKGSIERSLYLRDAEGNDWNYMKFWASQTLHMIPDLDISGLLDEVTTPLNYQTHYQLGFLPGAVDLWGTSLDDLGGLYPMGKQFITRPEIGWYVADSNSDNLLLSDGKLVKYAGIGMDQQPKNVYDLETSLPKNFRIEFSAINYAEGGVEITVMNTKKQPTYSPWTWNGVYLNANLGQVSYLDYQSHTTGDLRWISADTALIFAGKWQRYRIDVFEGDIRFYFNDSDPFIDSLWKEITSLSVTDASFRDGLSGALGGDYTVLFKVNKQLGLDNIKLIELTRDIYFSLDQTLKSDIVLDYDFNEFNFIDEVDFLKNIVSENKEFFYVAPHSEGHKANPVYIESETLHAGQVSTGDTSYYVFNLNGQGQGTFDVSLLNIDPNLSSDGLSIYHYQYSVTKSNQVGICEKTDEKSCQIEIKNSWENQILAIENQTQFDLTFQLLVMPSYLNPAVVELDLVTRGQIPENYLYSYYQFTTQEAGDYQLHFDFYDSENRYIDIYYNPDFTGWINNAVAPWNQDSFEIRLEGLKENTTFYFTVGYSPIKQSFDMTITRQDIVGPSFD
ncbi:MAG: hypothetical protein OEY59_13755, partial [Deltaproteobacteria bacterium]|nr:hypothetical protein [Deltaproteobacteria bacterium]